MIEFKEVVSEQDVIETVSLAREIWQDHYVSIIGQVQVDYMLNKFQSSAAINKQIKEGYKYYLVIHDGLIAGYLALIPDIDASSLMISKIYVKRVLRGKGIGARTLKFAESLCHESGFETIWLTVNKYNTNSIDWYERMGFANVGTLVQDIGDGFVMDDFKMEKKLAVK